MILIYSGVGATKMYKDPGMMRRTLNGFLNSLERQTDKEFRLFLSYHDFPPVDFGHEFIEWCPMTVDPECNWTKVVSKLPTKMMDSLSHELVPYGSPIDDLSRKTVNSITEAFLWAWRNGLKEFWLMRMDSDDLMARDTVERIHSFDKMGIRAAYNRKCHVFDPRMKEIGVYNYPFSTTANALKFHVDGGGRPEPRWFYMDIEHCEFVSQVQKDHIRSVELDNVYCILTNTGNNLSDRPAIENEKRATKISMTQELVDRYGLDFYLGEDRGQ
jgi:hypothetical protein